MKIKERYCTESRGFSLPKTPSSKEKLLMEGWIRGLLFRRGSVQVGGPKSRLVHIPLRGTPQPVIPLWNVYLEP
ncbi:MAG: hypothetical protein LUQ49_05365, partial [Methanomicrobiales archaeon]|nr:hypothetical protein [Methanomicrobiales archaeon]